MLVSGKTRIYGIVGNPVWHSLSPYMHNAAFREYEMDCIYVAFPARSARCVVDSVRCFGVCGLSITAPFKEEILEYLDSADESCEMIGAVNTIKYERGEVEGINTDWIGAANALGKKINPGEKRCLVVGAGGTARAVVYGLKRKGAEIMVVNRTVEKAESLGRDFDVSYGSLNEIAKFNPEILINTTPVGMEPRCGESLVPGEILSSVSVVMDVVYKPRRTRLLEDALRAGCRIVEGLEMLLEQGVAQFEWWTGRKAPRKSMAESIGLAGDEQ